MITTRLANSSDIDWLFEECKAFAKTYESKLNLASNEDYGRTSLGYLVENHLVVMSLKDGEPTGFIIGMKQPHHFNPDITMLSELFWWVKPEHRLGSSGAKLFKAFMDFGKQNCDCITFTLEETTPLSEKALTKRGFRLTEKAYFMEVN